ncbi:methylmalonyl-CoA epimerase, mitochondrial [Ctenodactylus gundi]
MARLLKRVAAAACAAGEYWAPTRVAVGQGAEEATGRPRIFSSLYSPLQTVRVYSMSQNLHQVSSPVWKLGRLNHVAIAVPDLEKAAAFYKNILGAQVDNIDAAVMDLKEKKVRSLSEEAKIGAHGKPVIFLHPKDCGGVLIELEQA